MTGREEEAAVQADAYIDTLLATHGGSLVALPPASHLPDDALRGAIELLAARMPRFHPSFRFEEWLAIRLREAAASHPSRGPAQITPMPLAAGAGDEPALVIDRRLLLGGAIASGVSIAGAAMIVRAAQRRGRPRPIRQRLEWLS